MLDPDEAIDEALQQAAASGRPPLAHLSTSMVEALRPYLARMPAVASDAFAVADRYWNHGLGTPDDLVAARVACWGYMQSKNGDSSTISGRGDYLTRAVLCVLYDPSPDGQDDLGETAFWFRDFVAGARDAHQE